MNYFSTDYFAARSKFITATNLHNGRLKSDRLDAEIPLAAELTIGLCVGDSRQTLGVGVGDSLPIAQFG